MKIDLVIWTYNSAKTLNKCLSSIDSAIPESQLCHRIAIDAGSHDKTVSILKEHGWEVEEAPRKGIPYQANRALELVDNEYFASFEHDIILNPTWFEKTARTIDNDPTVGAVQGVRLYTGSETMRAIESWQYRARLIAPWTYSIDNTLFRTEAVRRAGGFSDECMASADGILRRSMFRMGYKWITDYDLVSGHYRRNFIEHFRHQMKNVELATYFWSTNPESETRARRLLSMLGGNPRNVLRMTIDTRMLRVPLAWYILRFEKGVYLNLPHETKAIRPVAMDDWYLEQFENAIVGSGKDIVTRNDAFPSPHPNGVNQSCEWCSSTAKLVYAVPSGWSLILPRLHRLTGNRLFVCSEDHARKIAERLFKNAFEYVTKEN